MSRWLSNKGTAYHHDGPGLLLLTSDTLLQRNYRGVHTA
jgi:hypothetical protein